MKDYIYNKELKLLLFLTLFSSALYIAGFREFGFDRDSLQYRYAIERIINDVGDYNSEITLYLIVNAIKLISNNVDFVTRSTLLLYAFISLSLKFYFIFKFSTSPVHSLLIYLLLFFIIQDLTQIRVAVAVAFIYFAIDSLSKGKRELYLIFVFIAFSFHFSAIVLVFFCLLNVNRINKLFYFTLLLVAVVLSSNISFVQDLNSIFSFVLPNGAVMKLNMYLSRQEGGDVGVVNKFNLLMFFFLFFNLIFIVFSDRLKIYDLRFILWTKLLTFSNSMFYFFSSIPVLAFRLSELLNVVIVLSLPMFIKFIPNREIKCAAYLLIYIVLIGYVYNLIAIQKVLNF